MFVVERPELDNLNTFYEAAIAQLEGLLFEERDVIANLANVAAFLNQLLTDVNWVGFYMRKEEELVLGPFQGKVACIRIAMGRGVCGSAASQKKTQLVADVHAFEGHIACDGATKSEIVVPIMVADQVVAVLDIDSPVAARFSEVDQKYLEKIAQLLAAGCDW